MRRVLHRISSPRLNLIDGFAISAILSLIREGGSALWWMLLLFPLALFSVLMEHAFGKDATTPPRAGAGREEGQ